jgi:hypothetical protein
VAVRLQALSLIVGILVLPLAGLWSAGLGGVQAQAGCSAFTANLIGAEEVPPSGSSGTGTGTVVLNAAQTQITVNLTFTGLSTPANAGHIHGPGASGVIAPIVFGFSGVPAATAGSIPQQTFAITAAQVADLQAGLYYMNVHTTTFPDGEIRGQLRCPTAPTPNSTPTSTPRITVTPTATSTRVPGDINNDGFVDIRDYGIWRQQFGATDCSNPADLNSDCYVDIRDYGIWRQHFGEGTPPASVLPGAPLAPGTPTRLPGAAPAPARTPTPTAR